MLFIQITKECECSAFLTILKGKTHEILKNLCDFHKLYEQ